MSSLESIAKHYGAESLVEKVQHALQGVDPKHRWMSSAVVDQFHVRGLAATKELAALLKPEPGERVLDVGCGLGGPARYLANAYGCHVTGVDLSTPFVEVATMLSQQAGLSNQTSFLTANALDLPFRDGSFDHAWTQHVGMNIFDRKRFYSEIRRVLRAGSRLSIYDVIAIEDQPLLYPVPWASGPEMSFLMTDTDMREALSECGFVGVSWQNTTPQSIAWFAQQKAARTSGANRSSLGLQLVMGAEFEEMAANLAENLAKGAAGTVQVIVQAAGCRSRF